MVTRNHGKEDAVRRISLIMDSAKTIKKNAVAGNLQLMVALTLGSLYAEGLFVMIAAVTIKKKAYQIGKPVFNKVVSKMMTFDTKINGIPCICKVISFKAGRSGKRPTIPENCFPDKPMEFEFEILDRRGRKAEWLERKITDKDETRLCEEYLGIRGRS